MYHRITDLEIDPWNLAISAKNFDEQLTILKSFYKIISLEELIENKKNNKIKKKSIVITFDDGYKDNYTTAYPILDKHQIPATFFINSGYIENQNEFWPDKLIRLILNKYKLPEKRLELKLIERYWDINIENYDKKARANFFWDIWYSLLQVHPNIREQALSKIAAWSNHDKEIRPDNLPMNKAELIDLAQQPLISIGAHTSNHAALSFLDIKSQREEIRSNKLWLENVLNRPILGFSYPNGSYNSDTISLMKEMEFKYACTTKEMRNSSYISDYELPRYQVYNWNSNDFINKIKQW
jgi:peptidoglycan/xylan/chitin deacetylase (PgdA/CDA1 family)